MIGKQDIIKITNLYNYAIGEKILDFEKCFKYYEKFLLWKDKTDLLYEYDKINIENKDKLPFLLNFINFVFFKEEIFVQKINNLNSSLLNKLLNERKFIVLRSKDNGKYWCLKKLLNTWTEINLENHDFKKVNENVLLNNYNKFECLISLSTIELLNLIIKKYKNCYEIFIKILSKPENFYNKIELFNFYKEIFSFYFVLKHINLNCNISKYYFQDFENYFIKNTKIEENKFLNLEKKNFQNLFEIFNNLIYTKLIINDKKSKKNFSWINILKQEYNKDLESEIENNNNIIYTKEISNCLKNIVGDILSPLIENENEIKIIKELEYQKKLEDEKIKLEKEKLEKEKLEKEKLEKEKLEKEKLKSEEINKEINKEIDNDSDNNNINKNINNDINNNDNNNIIDIAKISRSIYRIYR